MSGLDLVVAELAGAGVRVNGILRNRTCFAVLADAGRLPVFSCAGTGLKAFFQASSCRGTCGGLKRGQTWPTNRDRVFLMARGKVGVEVCLKQGNSL